MKPLALLALAAALALSACDGGDPAAPDMRGAAGAAGVDGTAGVAGAAGASGAGGAGGTGGVMQTPVPACPDPDPTATSYQIACEPDPAQVPIFTNTGVQCYYCPGRAVPDVGCTIHIPGGTTGGGTVIIPARDIFCAAVACDPNLCHPK